MIKYKIEGYLTDFQCDLQEDPYNLSDDVQLVKLDSEEQESFSKTPWDFIYVPLNRPKWKLIKSIEVGNHINSDAVQRIMEGLLTAFRLTHQGGMEIRTIKCNQPAQNIHFTHLRTFAEGIYTLEQKDLSIISEIYSKLNASLKNKLETGLIRFNLSYHEHRLEDKLLDYIIILEALLLTDKLELALKLAINYVCLLHGLDEKEKKERIFKFLKKAYSLRNDLVHGALPKLPDKIIYDDDKELSKEDFINELKEKVRSLLKFSIYNQSLIERKNLEKLSPF